MARKYIKAAGGFIDEFKRFAVKGNAFDLAIAVVVGNAFSGIVNSLVADVITPLLSLLTNNVDFKTLSVTLSPGAVVKYGAFLQAIFNFVVIAFAVFIIFKIMSTTRERLFRKGEQTPQAQKPEDVRLLEEIRDLLKEGKGV